MPGITRQDSMAYQELIAVTAGACMIAAAVVAHVLADRLLAGYELAMIAMIMNPVITLAWCMYSSGKVLIAYVFGIVAAISLFALCKSQTWLPETY